VELILDAVGGASFKKGYRSLSPTGRLGTFGISSAATGKERSVTNVLATLSNMPWLQFNPLSLMNANKAYSVSTSDTCGERSIRFVAVPIN
jgi:synaptic vesicle membrane protein VAT-1